MKIRQYDTCMHMIRVVKQHARHLKSVASRRWLLASSCFKHIIDGVCVWHARVCVCVVFVVMWVFFKAKVHHNGRTNIIYSTRQEPMQEQQVGSGGQLQTPPRTRGNVCRDGYGLLSLEMTFGVSSQYR